MHFRSFRHIGLLTSYLMVLAVTDCIFAQEPDAEEIGKTIDEKIEYLTERAEGEIDPTILTERLYYYLDNPLNINMATEEELSQLLILNPVQINNLLTYRMLYGNILSIYELQSVRGFDRQTIEAIMPFVTLEDIHTGEKISVKDVVKYGRHKFMFRWQRILEDRAGYQDYDSAALAEKPNSVYLGSPDKLYARYAFNYRNKIRFGLVAENDPGEVFLKNSIPEVLKDTVSSYVNNGFDFYSGFFYLSDMKFLKKLVIGDYHLQFGQGLTMWSSLAFGKSPDAINIKRYASLVRPNTSANENGYLRGTAATFSFGNVNITGFYSKKNRDANLTGADTTTNELFYISSLQETGYHRKVSEILDRNAITETVWGGNVSFNRNRFKIGGTYFITRLSHEIETSDNPYKKYYFAGNKNQNLGVDYNYLMNKINIFGEFSGSENGGYAMLHGMTAQAAERLSFSLLYRNYQRDYQNLYANAFAENSYNFNEQGIYAGVRLLIHADWLLNAYTDLFVFPWLKFRTNAPSSGNEQTLQLEYRPSRNVQMDFRYRHESKAQNTSDESLNSDYLIQVKKHAFRYHITYDVTKSLVLKNRFQVNRYSLENDKTEQGFMVFQDVVYKMSRIPLAFYARYAVFSTPSYDTRIYAYENDVLYAFSIPAYYYKGNRFYMMLKYSINDIDIWLRYSRFHYPYEKTLSSGPDQIDGNTKSEIKIQLMLKF